MFKKKKEKPINSYINESTLEAFNDEEITRYLKKMYPIGTTIDQKTAYDIGPNCNPNDYVLTTKDNYVSIVRKDKHQDYTNIAIGGCGIWNSDKKKLAKIIKK